MSCHEARELFSAKADERLAPGERSALDGHLAGCAACAQEWERFRRTVGLLRSVEEARAPVGFAQRVLETARREPWPQRLVRQVFLPLRVKLPLEAAALVLVSTLVIVLYRQAPEVHRAAEAPPSVSAPAPASEPSQKDLKGSERREYEAQAEKDQPAAKKEAAPAERQSVGGRLDAMRKAGKAPAPAAEPKLAARAQGPFHLVGLLRPKNREALESQLGDLVKQVGGILVRDAERVRPGSVIEVTVPREAYPRLEAGLRQLGDFTVESRARTFPEQLRIGLRIAD